MATSASIWSPYGVVPDASGNLFIADTYINRVRKVDTNGIITTVVGTGTRGFSGDGGAATNATLYDPYGVAFDASGNMYVADQNSNRIRKVNSAGIISTVAGNGVAFFSGDGGTATNASLDEPMAVAQDGSGNLFVADALNYRIRKVCGYACYPTFTLTNLGPVNAGTYTVVISSPYGSVTSAVATLTVTIPSTPSQILTTDGSFGFQTNQFGFNVSGAFGQTLVVDGSTNLLDCPFHLHPRQRSVLLRRPRRLQLPMAFLPRPSTLSLASQQPQRGELAIAQGKAKRRPG